MAETHEGYLLIADITGYTLYLSESELEHAQETLTALLELLVKNTRPPLVISRLAGDAVISYGLRESFFQGQTLIEKVEDSYVAFRKAIERLVLNNSCRCNACANISTLDLKFFIHFGSFGIQRISDHDELVGSDVNLIHRLLKNTVVEQTGLHAYALYSEAALTQLGVDGQLEGMTAHSENYEHLGEVQVWLQDMVPVWQEKRGSVSVTLPEEQIWQRNQVDIKLPREQVWDYLIQPQYRNILIGADKMLVANKANGRIAPGSVYQCYHGDKLVPQTILEWHPFESMIVKELFPMAMAVSYLAEYHLESTETGTSFSRRMTKPSGPFAGRMLLQLLAPLFVRMTAPLFTTFAQKIEEDARKGAGEAGKEAAITPEQIRQAAGHSLHSS